MKVKIIMKGIYEKISDFENKINEYIEQVGSSNIIDIKYKVDENRHFAMIMVK